MREAERALAAGDIAAAERSLALAMLSAPHHPATLLLLGRCQFARSQVADAIRSFEDALAIKPDDVDTLIDLSKVQRSAGDNDSALENMQKAAALDPSVDTLLELGVVLDAVADAQGALDVSDRVIALDPASARGRLLRARCLQALGDIDATAAEYREIIRRRQNVPAAWCALMDIKTIMLSDGEKASLQREFNGGKWNEVERSWLGFAFGRACEDAGQ